MNRPLLVAVVGPTGSGKTEVGIRLARHCGAPVLSTDSRQVYRGMAIGTAQPTEEQLRLVRHYFIADRDIGSDFNCGLFEREALGLLDDLFRRHDTVIAVGGSGLYVRALCEGMDELPPADPLLRRRLEERLHGEGLAVLAAELRQLDPDYCRIADLQNPSRVLRALEVSLSSGLPCSSFRTGERRERDFRIVKIGIELPREELYARIDRRVEAMMAAGLEEEARALYPYRHLNALQTVGYRELFEWFDGILTRDEAVDLLKRNTRRYAKRQLTWFRRDPGIRWFAPDRIDEMIRFVDFHRSK